MRRPFHLWFQAVVYAGFLIWVSSLQVPKLPKDWWDQRDKVVHVALYVPLGILLRRATGSTRGALALGAAFAMGDELYQEFVSGREGDIWDWLADVAGVSIGAYLFVCYERQRRRHTPSGTR